jgi:hypothetical protein
LRERLQLCLPERERKDLCHGAALDSVVART